jgi:hypothetical protein
MLSPHQDLLTGFAAQQRLPDRRFVGNAPGTWIGFVRTHIGRCLS